MRTLGCLFLICDYLKLIWLVVMRLGREKLVDPTHMKSLFHDEPNWASKSILWICSLDEDELQITGDSQTCSSMIGSNLSKIFTAVVTSVLPPTEAVDRSLLLYCWSKILNICKLQKFRLDEVQIKMLFLMKV